MTPDYGALLGYHDRDYEGTRKHMRYSAGGGWWTTDEKPLPVSFGTPEATIAPDDLGRMWAEDDAAWQDEMRRAGGDTGLALQAWLAGHKRRMVCGYSSSASLSK